jgi:hypothetical protein
LDNVAMEREIRERKEERGEEERKEKGDLGLDLS